MKKTKALRDSKTGRFLPKTEVKTVKAKKESAPKAKAKAQKGPKASKNIEVGQVIERVLHTPLEVFIKKDITGKSKNILAGNQVIMEKLAVVGPTGSNVFRVKRANCERTYYTIEEKLV